MMVWYGSDRQTLCHVAPGTQLPRFHDHVLHSNPATVSTVLIMSEQTPRRLAVADPQQHAVLGFQT